MLLQTLYIIEMQKNNFLQDFFDRDRTLKYMYTEVYVHSRTTSTILSWGCVTHQFTMRSQPWKLSPDPT